MKIALLALMMLQVCGTEYDRLNEIVRIKDVEVILLRQEPPKWKFWKRAARKRVEQELIRLEQQINSL